MKDKLLSFLVLPSIMFALFLAFSPVGNANAVELQNGEWRDTGVCVANACGSSEGTQLQTFYERVCEVNCPSKHFIWREYEACPDGYKVDKEDESLCVKKDSPDIEREFEDLPFDIQYVKSSDPNKCHRPSDSQMEDDYGMSKDAVKEFKKVYDEWYYEQEDCDYEATTQTQTISCSNAPIVACPAEEDDDPDVLGEDDETGVVLAATGPTDNIVVYIVELLLVAMLVTYSVFFTKTYLKNSK